MKTHLRYENPEVYILSEPVAKSEYIRKEILGNVLKLVMFFYIIGGVRDEPINWSNVSSTGFQL